MIKKLNALLTKQDKFTLVYLILLSILVAMIETIGIAAIMPFISLATDFSLIGSKSYYQFIYTFFHFSNPITFVISFGIILIIFYILRSFINILYYYLLAKFSKNRIHILAYRLYENYLGMPYKSFLNKSTGELTKNIITETQYLTNFIFAILLMISEFFVIIFIYSAMIIVNWKVAFIITVILFINALFLFKTISKKLKYQGNIRAQFQKELFEIISSTFGNFKLIKLQSNDDLLVEKFHKSSELLTKSHIRVETLSHFPRLFLEAIGFSLLTGVIIYLLHANQNDVSQYLGMFSMFVLGLYRLMPSANRILSGFNQIHYTQKALELIYTDLTYKTESLGESKVEFKKRITLEGLSFGYDEHKFILKDIDLTITRHDKVAIIGASGSGKSTLVDMIIGLYRPLQGKIMVDDTNLNDTNIKDWRKKIGYIPQQVYLFNGTVAENVAFGLTYNETKIKKVLQQANVLSFLEDQMQGIDTHVGDGGIKLSGGQKQRIAIARALYSDPEILVLDEATSALDTDTESLIMEEIYKLSHNMTLFIIAHRLSTLNGCNRIFRIENQTVIEESLG